MDSKDSYMGLEPGDIVKTGDGFRVVVSSDNYLTEVNYIPLKRIKNDENTILRVQGGKSGFQLFVCKEKVREIGKTEFFAMEWLSWESDPD